MILKAAVGAADVVQGLEREAALLRAVAGPGTPTLLSAEEDEEGAFLVMADGGHRALEDGPWSLAAFFPLALQLTRILERLHAQGVIHKDINPSNIVRRAEDGDVLLIDFGVSRWRTDPPAERDLLEGTLAYIAPEQTNRMNRAVDHRSDLYSLGVSFFQILSGQRPFEAEDALGYVHCHLSKEPPGLHAVAPAVPEMLSRIVARLLAKDPDDRYASARSLQVDLQECARQQAHTGTIQEFPLGRWEQASRLEVSRVRVGHAAEKAQLLEGLTGGLTLLRGAVGSGRSALLGEVVSARPAQTLLLGASCDPRQQDISLGVMIAALTDLVRDLLTESDAQLRAWRQVLGAAVEPNGQVLVELIPELAHIIGPQPALPSLPPREAVTRTRRLFLAFLRALHQQRPLLVVLDDLEWVDAGTAELLLGLLSTPGLEGIAVLGTLCAPSASLDALVASARQHRPADLREVALAPLTPADVADILSATLQLPPAAVLPLAGPLAEKSAGNPMFVGQLVDRLHQEGALGFDMDAGRWAWDPAAVAQVLARAELLDILLERLEGLSAAARGLLERACGAGELLSLSLLDGLAPRDAAALEALCEANLIAVEPASGALEPVQSRIAEVVLASMDPAARVRLHRQLGLHLLETSPAGIMPTKRLFAVVYHLERGAPDQQTWTAREQLIGLEREAARRASASAGHRNAAQRLETALGLLTPAEQDTHHALFFAMFVESIEACMGAGDVERALERCGTLLPQARDALEIATVRRLEVQICSQQGQLLEALTRAQQALAELGLEIPSAPADIGAQVGVWLGRMQARLQAVPPAAFVTLPLLSAPETAAKMELLFQMVPAAFQLNPPLFVLTQLIMFELAMTEGLVPASCKNIADCGIIQAIVLNDPDRALQFFDAAEALLERFPRTPLASSVGFIRGVFAAHLRDSMDDATQILQQSVQDAALGDGEHGAYSDCYLGIRAISCGEPLPQAREIFLSAAAYAQEVGVSPVSALARTFVQAIDVLAEDADQVHAFQDEVRARLATEPPSTFLALGCHVASMLDYRYGRVAEAWAWVEHGTLMVPTMKGLFLDGESALYRGLIAAAARPLLPEDAQERATAILEDSHAVLVALAARNPEWFAGMGHLLTAERGRLLGAPLEDICAAYEQALQGTGQRHLSVRALAAERHAHLWLERGVPRLARPLLKEALVLIQRWGGTALGAHLYATYPALTRSMASGVSSKATVTSTFGGSLDVDAVTKATQAISSEVKTDRLFARLISTIMESAGAQHGCLLVAAEDGLWVEAQAHDGQALGLPRAPLATAPDVARDVVHFVMRTLEPVVLDDACAHERFGRDAHIRRRQVRSLLCLPVLSRSVLVGVFYAENSTAVGAFTASRIRILQIIAGQAATSIQNARLYEQLEERVAARTVELAQRNREIEALFDSLPQGVFTFGEALTIEPRYSAQLPGILGRDALVGAGVEEVLFADAAISAEQRSTHMSVLAFGFGSPAVLAEVNRVHLVQSFSRALPSGEVRFYEADWTSIVDQEDCVEKVMVTLRDVTALRALEQAVQENLRERDITHEILQAGLDDFQTFAQASRARLAQNATRVGALSPADVEEIFRNLHTIKGNARLLGLSVLSAAAHAAEGPFAALREGSAPPDTDAALWQEHHALLACLGEHEQILQSRLGGMGSRSAQQLHQLVAALQGVLSEDARTPTAALRRIQGIVARQQAVSAHGLVERVARMLPSLAQELNKPAPVLDIQGDDVLLTASFGAVLGDVLVHLFRNAFDHGIEAPAARTACGKPAEGRITVQLDAQPCGGLSLQVRDDGRGLALARLRERHGSTASDEVLAESIFQSGTSTAAAVTSISGRGVGMDIVRSYLEARGGRVAVSFRGEARAGFRPFALVLSIPPDAVCEGEGADVSTEAAA